MSLLSIVGDAMVLCGQTRPTIVYSTSDPTVAEFEEWLTFEGNMLATRDWPQLKVLWETTGDGSTTLVNLPTGFSRWLAGDPFWLDGEPGGPLLQVTDEEMLMYKASSTNPVRPVWRRLVNQIEFYPALETTETVKAEYRTKYWIMDSTLTTRKAAWDADDNESILPDEVLTAGLVWRWKKSKGLEWETFREDYEQLLINYFTGSDGRRTIKINDGGTLRATNGFSDPSITVS